MKIFISADIEGVATTTLWPETEKGSEDYRLHAQQMTMEVIAACEAASEAGASEIGCPRGWEQSGYLEAS